MKSPKKVEIVKKLLNTEELVIISPNALNLRFNTLHSLLNKSIKVQHHKEDGESPHYVSRDAQISMLMTMDGVYEATTPQHNKFCFSLVPAMFGFDMIIAFAKSDYFKLVRELRKLTKSSFKNDEDNPAHCLPILEPSFVNDILSNSVEYLKTLKKYRHLNLKGRRGIIFSGPPGNGKTMLCRHIQRLAHTNGFTVDSFNGAEIDKAYAKNELAEMMASANIIFFDDVDISYFSRTTNGKQSCSLLSAMDGLKYGGICIRIFSTNEKIENMDEAFLRPGRIDKIYQFDKPTGELRERFIKDWKNDDIIVDVYEVVQKTDGLSFAQLSEIRNEILLSNIFGYNKSIDEIVTSMSKITSVKSIKKVGFNK